jgi:hypothetical protein
MTMKAHMKTFRVYALSDAFSIGANLDFFIALT